MSGTKEPKLLVASHIVPWSKDKKNRLNPRNGLCLSAIHDRAFDKGLIALSDDLRVVVSRELAQQKEKFVVETFEPLEGKSITVPRRFKPDLEFIRYHRREIFLGA